MISGFLRRFMSNNLAMRCSETCNRLIWIDCEMTGYDLEKCRLVEIACIITDEKLQIIDEFGPVVINQKPEVLEEMHDWCKKTFKSNGLLERIKESKITEKEAEKMFVEFMLKHTKPGECPLAGNSIYIDRQFLAKYMSKIVDHLHYRIVDVSTIKGLVSRWYSEELVAQIPRKKENHLAMDDIRESIEELKYYKKNFFK